ncbi:hypothetical protein TRP8649_03528 [Pelagimonas phthalicica]|uniref:Uncharacterized protein n=2 Tax=Pelagimonas phthalicica TaxID=1037362 RepID=A0A238JGR8_9RHOB|nr:hypothetical protein CLV87_3525 [Pelagimonas phthalicica]SMX29394.1 hypothetical protein TRP8649_03528 [Pelagimonas phthalicica]
MKLNIENLHAACSLRSVLRAVPVILAAREHCISNNLGEDLKFCDRRLLEICRSLTVNFCYVCVSTKPIKLQMIEAEKRLKHIRFKIQSDPDNEPVSPTNDLLAAAESSISGSWRSSVETTRINANVLAARAILALTDLPVSGQWSNDLVVPAETIFSTPLWMEIDPPEPILSYVDSWGVPTESWGFWRKWYDSFLIGEPISVELQRRVAEIPDEVWQSGPEAVAKEIARIEAEWLAEQVPQAEVIELNPETQKFFVTPIPVENPPLTYNLISRVEDALEDAVQGHNGLNERTSVVRKLQRCCQRYANDPQRVEMEFTSAAVSLRRQMHESFEIPDSEDNIMLLEAVEEGVRGIRASHPEVAQNREQLAKLKVKELLPEEREILEQAEPVLRALSEGQLEEDFAEDIPQLLNTSVGPLPTGSPALPGVDASMRVFSRAAKIMSMEDKIDKMHDGKAHRSATMANTVWGLGGMLYKILQIGLRLFGVGP